MTICSRLARRAARLASLVRRSRAGYCLLLLGLGTITACSVAQREPPRQYTAAQQRMLAKFGPIGYELRVDAIRDEAFYGVNFYEVGKRWPIYDSAKQSLKGRSNLSNRGPIPEQVRVVWRKSSIGGSGPNNYDDYVEDIIGDEIIEVGSRIPQALIDDLKRDPRGTLRLKFRMSKQGTMLGWDIQRRPGYDPNKRDRYGDPIYVGPVHSFADGDFREAEIFNGKVVRPGWYIDRKTGQKIETDY